jgi:hypothetical protein
MMSRTTRSLEQITFSATALDGVVIRMARLSESADGWINLIPDPTEDDSPVALGFFSLFGGGSSGVTMGTWIPPGHDRRGPTPARVGITHLTGHRAAGRLAELGVAIPEQWRIEQDHPRRGLVLLLPPGEAHEAVLRWTLRAIGSLSTDAPGNWRADVYFTPAN